MDAEQFWDTECLENTYNDGKAELAKSTALFLLELREQLKNEGVFLEGLVDDVRESTRGTLTLAMWSSIPARRMAIADVVYDLASGREPYFLPFAHSSAIKISVDKQELDREPRSGAIHFQEPVEGVNFSGEFPIWLSRRSCAATDSILSRLISVKRAHTPIEVRLSSCCRQGNHSWPRESSLNWLPPNLDPQKFRLYAANDLRLFDKEAKNVERVAHRVLDALKVRRVLLERPDLSGRLMLTGTSRGGFVVSPQDQLIMSFSKKDEDLD